MVLEDFKKNVLPVKDKLYRFSLYLLGNEDDARDVVQDVLIKAWDNRAELSGLNSVEAWCMRITRNFSLNRLNAASTKYKTTIDALSESSYTGASPETLTEVNDQYSRFKELLEELPATQRQILQLRDIEGFTNPEIAEALGVEVNYVKVNLFRARQSLKKKMLNLNAYGLQRNQ
ncbi:sigma-70 family RNA polymerase sigma factor [Flammeovirgaceae bacterium SG7u.111]|nr:sigma-70 family RNA polymerase sigma factor [Flammeovirgaceae bacterium SG7u.132]WPO38771.1 sigma-70 family RNA polymerase sigma factor [Flammeovirgaceae bacterium SG7u.111]